MAYDDKAPPSSTTLLAKDAAQRQRKLIIALVVAVVVIGASIFVGSRLLAKSNESELAKPWSQLHACLLGPPLGPNERPSARVRNVQLTAMSTPEEKRMTATDAGWPARCATYAHGVSEVTKRAGEDKGLVVSSEKLAKALKDAKSVTANLGKEVEDAWADAEKRKLVATAVEVPIAPPKPARPMVIESLPTEAKLLHGSFALSSIYAEPSAGPTLRLVIDDKALKDGPVVCSMPPGATKLHCTKIPAPAATFSPGLRPWGTTEEGGVPFLFVGDRGRGGIFRGDTGARVVEGLTYGAYGIHVRRDASFSMLIWNEKGEEIHLVRQNAAGKSVDTKLLERATSGNPYYNTGLFWDWVVHKGASKTATGLRLMVRKIPADGGELGPIVDIGEIAEPSLIEGAQEAPHIRACKTAETMVLRVKGRSSEYLAFYVGDRWMHPVESTGTGGEMTCRGAEAVITDVYVSGVAQNRCDSTNCKFSEIVAKEVWAANADVMPQSAKAVTGADVDGKLVLAWLAGANGGLRTRAAAFDQIASAEETVVFDDRVQDGVMKLESSILDMRLLSAGGRTLLFLSTVPGVFVFRVDAKGALSPLQVE